MRQGEPAHRVRWREWGLLSIALLAAVLALVASRGLEHIDLALTDQIARLSEQEVSREVVIVAIDDKSLAEIGRWPWRRAFHAALLDRIGAAGPRAVGLDLLLVEPDETQTLDDALLGDAIARNGKVVLPLMLLDAHGTGRLTRTDPAPALASAAAAIGHVHVEIDRDGIVRSTFLREGDSEQWWDHFAVALLHVGGFPLPDDLGGERAPTSQEHPDTWQQQPDTWQRDHGVQIPFAGPPGSFTRVSYVDVLKGRVPRELLAGKYVLVGATAAGMGDAYATPRSGEAELMPGVEISANVLNGLLLDHRLERANGWQNALFCIIPVAAALLAVLLLTPTASLVFSGALLVSTLCAAALTPAMLGLQFAPSAGLLGVLLAYPLWVWRRLRTATDYLLEEFQRMETRRDLPTMLPAARPVDQLDQHIGALRDASQQLRNLHRFVSETLNSLPDATLIADATGEVLVANQAAEQYFSSRHGALHGCPLHELLQQVHRTGTQQPVLDTGRLRHGVSAWGAEARDAAGRDLLVRFVPCFNTDGETTSWIASLVDITPIREAERQRDVALRFISHDMRSPQASILALLEVQRMDPTLPMPADMMARIERHARRTLDLAEEFVQLARAESSAYRMETVNLADLLDEAVDEVWPQAQALQVELRVLRPSGPANCEADRGLLTRAIANLVGNAVKYGSGACKGEVLCALQPVRDGWQIAIADNGPGMTLEQQQRLFQQFARINPGDSAQRGVGLGLVFVRTVVERHGSRIEVNSQPGQGTTFHFTLAAVRP